MAKAPATPENLEILAAELAIGLLEGDALTAALRLQLADREFAALVLKWHRYLAPLLLEYTHVPAPETLWPRIAAELGLDRTANDTETSYSTETGGAGKGWRMATFVTGAIAAGLAITLLVRPAEKILVPLPETQETRIADLSETAGGPVLSIDYAAADGTMRINASNLPKEAGKAAVLWAIPGDGVPKSLGPIASSGASKLALAPPEQRYLEEGATLAVTIEDAGAASYETPTMPIVASGTVKRS